MAVMLSEEEKKELKLRKALRANLPYFSDKVLRIRTKSASGENKDANTGLAPLRLNAAQMFLHQKLTAQKADNKMVRAIIVKGRQQGCSTYVAARFFWNVTSIKGVWAFILTHESAATKTLFDMAKRFYDNIPKNLRPVQTASNIKELAFGGMNSGYSVGTAQTGGVGRSLNVQFFHGSEVAYWKNARDHAAGVMQAVGDEVGTEIILESTAAGIGNFFHETWISAVKGLNGYEAIFIPWFWQDEYAVKINNAKIKRVKESLTLEERRYMEVYKLTLGNILWRRVKVSALGENRFKQEYPLNDDEAFTFSESESLIKALDVKAAMQRPFSYQRTTEPLYVGFDPSRDGGDRDAIAFRQGNIAFKMKYEQFSNFRQRLNFCKRIIGRPEQPLITKMFIDYGGSGWELVSSLISDGYGRYVRAVDFGASADNRTKYRNKRAEIWCRMGNWFTNEIRRPCVESNEDFAKDITAPSYEMDTSGCITLESKRSIKKRINISPDGGDALALTFTDDDECDIVNIEGRAFRRIEREFGKTPRVRTEYDVFSPLAV